MSGSLSGYVPEWPVSRQRSYLASALVGKVLDGRFELKRLAATGGMGEIFESIDRSTGNPVAVKVLSALRPAAVRRFEREATILASVRHDDIVGYVAHGATPSGEPYLVMDWLAGEDLAVHLLLRRFTVTETLVLGARIGDALGAMHAQGLVHRDVKPANILLVNGDAAQAKVLDLGLARGKDMKRLTEAGSLVGTLGYIAPEQARGERSIDARADVFSLGCVLFKCLTGTPVFTGVGMMALLASILHQEAPRLRDRCPEAPPGLDALLARMLAKDPDERPANGYEVAAALRAIAGDDSGVPLAVEPRHAVDEGEAEAHPRGDAREVDLGLSAELALDADLPGAPAPGARAGLHQPPTSRTDCCHV